MTVGLWHRTDEEWAASPGETRPSVSVAWPLGSGRDATEVWLDVYEGSHGRSAVATPEGSMSGGKLVGLTEVMGQARRCGVSSR